MSDTTEKVPTVESGHRCDDCIHRASIPAYEECMFDSGKITDDCKHYVKDIGGK